MDKIESKSRTAALDNIDVFYNYEKLYREPKNAEMSFKKYLDMLDNDTYRYIVRK